MTPQPSGLAPTAEEAEVAAWLTAQSQPPIETACARVFLAGDAAWKVKRNADLGYVDFTTLERRKWALDRELEFNRATAGDIYRRVRAITREAGGGLAWDGSGAVVDYALEMRRFDEGAVLAANPDAVDGALAERLGRMIADVHAEAPLRPGGGWRALDWTIQSNAARLRELAGQIDAGRVETLVAATQAEFERQRPLLEARTAEGFARRCHGDLHLGNILLEDGTPVLFDALEFSDLLSDLDVLFDLAFLLMDLDFRGRRDAGARVLSAYLDEAARCFPPSLWDGVAALPLMLSVRASVRAHVEAHAGDLVQAAAYVEAAIAHLSPSPAVLAAVGGFSGTGKSTFARAVAPGLGRSPGAVVLRTDEARKRLAGAGPVDHLPREVYTPQFYARVYDMVFETARALLKAGQSVVLDATFTEAPMRTRAEALAAETGVAFRGAWLEAPLAVLEARVGGRVGDASDATLEVLHGQVAEHGGERVDWRKVDATQPTGDAARAWLELFGPAS
ncbi:bifunctional aminoglycoside phosphotransferase/ATP-binding protein [Phenylobacterium sp.]|uniref:bifunctional aminoglycoside phosphotransferase/ATP-binding protein n=1 Tax=Phenylobacterium sp. TaxID=1871053 RepID=UPI0011FE76B9|nr:bifunctional aminoglycoside phosphotransferase/ATP-binding protein [Phenylobacterium sp.]THD64801.1 MAG: gluconate kinase [Phenylobacterium sp.]